MGLSFGRNLLAELSFRAALVIMPPYGMILRRAKLFRAFTNKYLHRILILLRYMKPNSSLFNTDNNILIISYWLLITFRLESFNQYWIYSINLSNSNDDKRKTVCLFCSSSLITVVALPYIFRKYTTDLYEIEWSLQYPCMY